jgi:hypothetical protein
MIEIKPLDLKSGNGKENLGFEDIDLENADKPIKIELEEDQMKPNETKTQVESIENKEFDKEDNNHFISHLIIQIRSLIAKLIENVF